MQRTKGEDEFIRTQAFESKMRVKDRNNLTFYPSMLAHFNQNWRKKSKAIINLGCASSL